MRRLVVTGGVLVDGSGAPARRADVAVEGDRVVAIGPGLSRDAETVMDARGQLVVPGLVDTHAHTDFVPLTPVLSDEVRWASLRQGVTTEVCGNCGGSPFPCDAQHAGTAVEWLRAQQLDTAEERAYCKGYADYRDALAESSLAVNLAPLVGHGNLRTSVVGLQDRPASRAEVDEMAGLLARELQAGAFGFSTGLIYPPSMYGDADEITELARVVRTHGRVYSTHMRDESDGVLDAIEETLSVARRTGVRVTVSHLKAAGSRNWGRAGELLDRVAAARDEGLAVRWDAYPYTAGSTGLSALLPPWAQEGAPAAIAARLTDPVQRARIVVDLHSGLPGWNPLLSISEWDRVALAGTSSPELDGMRLTGAARHTGRSPADLLLDLLAEQDGGGLCVLHMMDAADVEAIAFDLRTMGGSDGLPMPGRQHPRLAGTFARYLARAVSEPDLAAHVHRLSGMPAQHFRIPGRGVITEGSFADLVLVDPDLVTDRATFEDPLARPVGITTVVVNGVVCVRDGEVVRADAGRLLVPLPTDPAFEGEHRG